MPGDTFTTQFARLVWLLVYRPGLIDDQKRALREALSLVRDEGVQVRTAEVSHAAADAAILDPPPEAVSWLGELANRMSAHSVRALDIHQGARAADVLGIARALALHGVGDDGSAFDAEVVALAPTTLSVHLGRDGFVRTPTPPGGMRPVGLRPRLTPSPVQRIDATAVRPSVLETPRAAMGAAPDAKARLMQQAIMPSSGELDFNDLLMRVRGELTPDGAPPLLDEIGRKLEDAARAGRWVLVVEVAAKLLDREEEVQDPDVRRAFGILFRRLSKTEVLRGLIAALVTHRELRAQIQRILVRQGDPAADLLVEQLVVSDSASVRRACRDAILGCPGAAVPLTHLLRDHRWFVVRNAVELLGELNATEADQELINTLRHADARVRRAATLALIKLGTPRAVHTIIQALGDREVSVRLKAAAGLGGVRNGRAAPALLAALERESEEEVAHAILASLGKHPTDDAVSRLAKEASPGSILRRRSAARRLVAIAALGEAATPEARRTLEKLAASDRDASVREAAGRALTGPVPALAS